MHLCLTYLNDGTLCISLFLTIFTEHGKVCFLKITLFGEFIEISKGRIVQLWYPHNPILTIAYL